MVNQNAIDGTLVSLVLINMDSVDKWR